MKNLYVSPAIRTLIILVLAILTAACASTSVLQKTPIDTAASATTTSTTATEPTAETSPPKAPDGSLWIPVIVYHRIGIAPKNANSVYKSLTIEPAWFEKHLQYLQDNGFTSIHFSDVTAYFQNGTPLPARPVIISFDDGYKDATENALPILQKHNMTGTFYIVSGLVGHRAYMTWEQVTALKDAGMEIGGHTVWHPYLTKISEEKARAEITDSKKKLEEKLGMTVTTFAYPFGAHNAKIEAMVKDAGFTTARLFTTGNGISMQNIFTIPVVRVYANIGLERWNSQLFPPKHL